MSDEQTQTQTPPRTARRSSFAGQTFADIFGTGRPSMSRNATGDNSPSSNQQMPGPISKAAAQAQQRRLSLTTLGLSGSPNQTSPFSPMRTRGDSIGSANSGSIDESAIAEDDGNSGATPSTPFARRTSFGAKALRDRMGSFSGQSGGGGGSQSPGQNGKRSPSVNNTSASKPPQPQSGTISARDAKGRGTSEGFNWSENLRNRAERTSIAGQGGLAPVGGGGHSRAKSVATMEPPPMAQPKPKEKPRPDHFQERILKGDFYMD